MKTTPPIQNSFSGALVLNNWNCILAFETLSKMLPEPCLAPKSPCHTPQMGPRSLITLAVPRTLKELLPPSPHVLVLPIFQNPTKVHFLPLKIFCCPLYHSGSDSAAAAAAAAKSLQSCSSLCDPIDGSPPGSPDPGILQARTLEWVAIGDSIQQWPKQGKNSSSLARGWAEVDDPGSSMGALLQSGTRISSSFLCHSWDDYSFS